MARKTFSVQVLALAFAVLLLGLAGCGNDNPATSGGTMRVDLSALKSQDSGFSTLAAGQENSAATTAVRSLIIGAVVITFTNTPLSSDTNVDQDLADNLANDVINSINFFSIVDLPVSEDFVEFKVPPPGAGDWQVAVVGTKNTIATFEDLDDPDVAIYYGFDEQFRSTSGSSGPDVDIEMKRACFIDNPPLGCAAILNESDSTVTGAVEILNVTDQDGSVIGGLTYPLIIGQAGETHTAAAAMTALNGLNLSGVTEVTIEVSHRRANGQSGACVASTSVANLRTNCGSGTIFTLLE